MKSLVTALILGLAVPALAAGPPPAAAPDAVRDAATQRLAELERRHPATRAQWRADMPTPALITGLSEPTDGATPLARALDFLDRHAELLGPARAGLKHAKTAGTRTRTAVRFQVMHGGLPVLDREVVVTLDPEGHVVSLTSDALRLGTLPPAVIDAAEAHSRAHRAAGVQGDGEDAAGAVIVTEAVIGDFGQTRRVWVVQVTRKLLREHLRVVVDATTGEVLSIRNMVQR